MKKKMTKKMTVTLLLMPLVLAIMWLIVVLASNKTLVIGQETQLAPVADTEPLIIGLAVFIVGYILFMVMMFYEDINTFLVKKKVFNLLGHKPKKKKK